MAYVYSCDCGYVCRGETAEEFVADVEAHIGEAHPDLVGKVSREDISRSPRSSRSGFLSAPRFCQTDVKARGPSFWRQRRSRLGPKRTHGSKSQR